MIFMPRWLMKTVKLWTATSMHWVLKLQVRRPYFMVASSFAGERKRYRACWMAVCRFTRRWSLADILPNAAMSFSYMRARQRVTFPLLFPLIPTLLDAGQGGITPCRVGRDCPFCTYLPRRSTPFLGPTRGLPKLGKSTLFCLRGKVDSVILAAHCLCPG